MVLASIREDIPKFRFGRQIGRASIDDEQSALLKSGHFKRLLDAETEDEIAAAFRRAISMLGGVADSRDVARLILFFSDDKEKRRLIFDYYAAGEREAEPPRAEA